MIYKLDYAMILNVSFHIRKILKKFAPEIVATAESFSSHVFYLPSSSFGCVSEHNEDKTFLGIAPKNIKPVWITTPMLLFLAGQGYIMSDASNQPDTSGEIEIENFRMVKNSVIFSLKGLKERMQLPALYCGAKLYHTDLDKWFTVPGGLKIIGQE